MTTLVRTVPIGLACPMITQVTQSQLQDSSSSINLSQLHQYCSGQMQPSSATSIGSCSPNKSESSKTNAAVLMVKKPSNPELGCLSDRSIDISPHLCRKVTVEGLTTYLEALAESVYESDPLKIRQLLLDFLASDLPRLRHRLQQRLSLLKYLCESLKYKQFGEMDSQMQREWRRNVLLISLNTIWASKMQGWQFTSVKQLVEEYHKHIAMVANLTHFYFREAFQLLKSKQFPTFTYLQDETAHHIVNALPDWEDIYHSKLVPLLQKENIQANMEPNFEFDLGSLQINENYMEKEDEEDEEEGGRVNRGEIEETRETVETRETGTNLASLKEGKGASRGVQLGETIRKIRQFTQEHTLQSKMIRLKQIRQTFLKQIEANRESLAARHGKESFSPLEKDDIIGCMIYCILRGRLKHLKVALQGMTLLLGDKNQLLARRGVDSYRADLESATQYLIEQNGEELIMVPQELKLFP